LLKYPTTLVRYDYSKKFGIDVPMFSHLREFEINRIKKCFPELIFDLLITITSKDEEAQDFIKGIDALPDITKAAIEEQIVNMEKLDIEGQGFKNYKKQRLSFYKVGSVIELPKKERTRMNKLEKWAIENDHLESKLPYK